jgi:hypothetical protein
LKMVDASILKTPPFTLYFLPQGEIALRRTGCIMKM